jgi:catechol 2,3-dioxygenase-like lactoylglutathione lyase family enzyme
VIGLTGIDHVQLAIPAGAEAEDQARRFYADLLGLREVPKPTALAGRGGIWLVGPGVVIHLGVETPFAPARKAHSAFLVSGLPALLAQLRAGGAEVTPDDALPHVRRAHVADPFGNRIELIEAADGGFTEPA